VRSSEIIGVVESGGANDQHLVSFALEPTRPGRIS
jgi:hypothetical protein